MNDADLPIGAPLHPRDSRGRNSVIMCSQLKRSLDGIHHHVSREHLQRYLVQFEFMYTHCKRNDSEAPRRAALDEGAADGELQHPHRLKGQLG